MAALPPRFTDWFAARGWSIHPHQQDMLDRAASRGETVPTSEEVFELVIAPLFASLLFGTDPPAVQRLVERVDLVAAHAADTGGE